MVHDFPQSVLDRISLVLACPTTGSPLHGRGPSDGPKKFRSRLPLVLSQVGAANDHDRLAAGYADALVADSTCPRSSCGARRAFVWRNLGRVAAQYPARGILRLSALEAR